jgi:hypothetical protein
MMLFFVVPSWQRHHLAGDGPGHHPELIWCGFDLFQLWSIGR